MNFMKENPIEDSFILPDLMRIENENDFKNKRPDGFFDVVKAIYMFGTLNKLDINLLLENLGYNRLTAFTITGLAKSLGYIYEKDERFFVNNLNSKQTTHYDSALFKIFLKFASLIGSKYSKAYYPSTICFVVKLQSGDLINVELVDGRYDPKTILFHLENRKEEKKNTRYFMLLNSIEEAIDLSLVKSELFPNVKVKGYIQTEKNKGYTLKEVSIK